ncbi:MAG: pyrroline-5-carboxylate reductase [Oscillospiraceae bacterium]
MLKERSIGFIGGGQMAEAILSGALKAGVLTPAQVLVTDISQERLEALAARHGVTTVLNPADGSGIKTLVAQCDVLVLCLKPQVLKDALQKTGAAFRAGQLVLSIVGGVSLATLEQLAPESPVIRVMPNTPMLVGKGSAGLAPGKLAGDKDITLCRQLFDAVGSTTLLPEGQMDAVTAVSGCGPAFAYLFIEALADGGVEQGLSRDLAQRLAAETLAGAAEMVLKTGSHPAQLKDNVCSPGGGTIAGVHALEQGAFRATVMNAVAAAKQRMEALGK